LLKDDKFFYNDKKSMKFSRRDNLALAKKGINQLISPKKALAK